MAGVLVFSAIISLLFGFGLRALLNPVRWLIAGLRADWGQTASTPRPGTMEMAVPAADPVAAWRYASWLVAHAAEDGLDQVQVAGMSWTSKGGRWNGPTTAPGPVTVTFRVHPDP